MSGAFVFLEVLCDEVWPETTPMVAVRGEHHGGLKVPQFLHLRKCFRLFIHPPLNETNSRFFQRHFSQSAGLAGFF